MTSEFQEAWDWIDEKIAEDKKALKLIRNAAMSRIAAQVKAVATRVRVRMTEVQVGEGIVLFGPMLYFQCPPELQGRFTIVENK